MSRQYKVTLWRSDESLRDPKSVQMPMRIEAVVYANDLFGAKNIAENTNRGYRATEAVEIKQPKPPASGSGGNVASSPSESRGCSGIIQGGMTLVGLLIVLAIVSQCSDKGGNPSSSQAPSSIPEANLEAEATQESARPISLVDTTPHQDSKAEQAQSIADTASQSAAFESAPGAAGSRARIVDSRDRIVLQSGPKMSSKNVAKIDVGSVVQVVSDEGKWVQVRTEDGLVGYVRRTQLETPQ